MNAPGNESQHNPRRLPFPARVASWSASRPRLAIVSAVVVTLLSLVSISQMQISTSLQAMLGEHSRAGAAMHRVTTEYNASDALLVLVELPPDRAADEPAKSELVDFAVRLEAELLADPRARGLIEWVRFRQDPNYAAFARNVVLPNGALYLPEQGFTELLTRLEPERIRAQIARNEAMIAAPGPAANALSDAILRDPLRLMELVPKELAGAGGFALSNPESATPSPLAGSVSPPEFSEDERALLVRIGSRRAISDSSAATTLNALVISAASRLNTAGLRVELAGASAISATSSRVIRGDAIVSTLTSVALLYFLFVLFYRRWMAALLIGGVAGVGILAGLGVHAIFAPTVSPLATAIAALLAGLGVDYAIHFMSHYNAYRLQGFSSVKASTETAHTLALPIITNCFTSIFGFISLRFSRIQMLSDFATMGAAGLIGALLAVFLLLPALLAVCDRKVHGASSTRGFGALADHVARRPRMWMTSCLLILLIAIAGAGFQGFVPRVEGDLTVMHPRPNRALDVTTEVLRRFSGQGEFIPVEIRAADADALVIAAHRVAGALQSQACRDVGVAGVLGLHLLLPDPDTARNAITRLMSLDADRVIDSFDAAIAESAFDAVSYRGYRDFLRTLVSTRRAPDVTDLLAYPSLAQRVFPTTILETRSPPTSTVVIVRLAAPLRDRLQRRHTIDALNTAIAPFTGVTVAGLAAVSDELEDTTRTGLPQSFALSVVLVLCWLLLVFRKPVDVLLALVPLAFASVTMVCIMVAFKQKFNPINSVAIVLLAGIAVDAGVFLVSVSRAHGKSRAELRSHLRSTTHAILLAVSTTATGFGALCFTHTPAIRSLGFVAATGVLASMIGAIFLLMPIVIRRAPENPRP